MPHELDKILISPSKRLVEIRSAVMQAATFDSDSDEGKQVLKIINKVRYEKDKAVAKFTKNYDYVELKPEQFRVSKEELKKAHKEIDYVLLTSLRRAIENVKKYQTEIFIGNKNTHPGIKYTPIKRIGICVPGASAPLPSTVIMTAVPAIVAGVKPEDIAIVSPPRYKPNPEAKGTIHPVTLERRL
jgi:histidinol dehydrogenase